MPLLPPSSLEKPDSDTLLGSFLDHLVESGTEPYDHQEQAILDFYQGHNVILNTPTGSGKTLVATAAQYRAIGLHRRSYYTVPIKALANEKFLSLCKLFGPESVGMITGDATVNPSAPVICCTAEILANLALREGAEAPVDDVVMDEFHYYSDPSRGFAWQIPLLTLPRARFLLMSATLGDPSFFQETLTRLTGAPTSLVRSDQRPVPLEFEYSETPLEEQVAELVERRRAPVYIVHFTQLACAQTAQNLLSSNFCSREEKQRLAEALQDSEFRSPYGREVAKLLRHGIGIHHAGLLPKYRITVEKLAQQGLLKVICGTDTLGVGVNVPIRTVLLTQLFKYDGDRTKTLSVRDFQQIAGRAGRRGFDTLGTVVCQAPEHVIENLRLEKKASRSGKKSFVKRKPPEKGFVPWDEKTFRRLIESPPERLTSSFSIQHSTVLLTLSRTREDGCLALRRLLRSCHEPAHRQRQLGRRAFRIFRGLVEGRILRIIPPHQRTGPAKVALESHLQDDFSLNQALGLYLLDTLPLLPKDDPAYSLNVLSLIEAILENPELILRRQRELLKGEMIARLKDEGVPYEERMERLEQVEHPQPGRDFIYDTYNAFVARHPWLKEAGIRPKSIAREMFEHWQSFEDYIKTYGLEKSEGVLLRHLSEVYKVLDQTVPPEAKTEELLEAEAYFSSLLRSIDSSLLDEWERLRHPETLAETPSAPAPAPAPSPALPPAPLSRRRAEFQRSLRRAVFDLLKTLASPHPHHALDLVHALDPDGQSWSPQRLDAALDPYFDEHHSIRLDPEARHPRHSRVTELTPRRWLFQQTLLDPDELNDWSLDLVVDLDQSDAEERPVLLLARLGSILESSAPSANP